MTHPLGITAHPSPRGISQADLFQQGQTGTGIGVLQFGEEQHDFQAGQIVVQGQAFRQITDAAPHLPKGFPAHRLAVNMNLTPRHRQQAQHHFEQGGLARAVVADQPEQLAGLHRQIHPVHRMSFAEVFDGAAHFNDVVCQANHSSWNEKGASGGYYP